MLTDHPALAPAHLRRARQKAIWMAGDLGRVARYSLPLAEEFMTCLRLGPDLRVLDVACGTGNLALIAARAGCAVTGIDIAPNLLVQAHRRATAENLAIRWDEGDAEQLPYADASFDLVVSMFGVMFAGHADRAAAELLRVCRPGGVIALANWPPDGFVGEVFCTAREFAPPAKDWPSPLRWGEETTVRERLGSGVARLDLTRCSGHLRFPFSASSTVDFLRQFFGPAECAFESLSDEKRAQLRRALVSLFSNHNLGDSNTTEIAVPYLRVIAVRTPCPAMPDA